MAGWVLSPAARAQSASGQLDVALQGYALAQQNQTSYIAGPSFQFSEFLPGRGLLSGRFEALGRDGGLSAGENYLEFRGFPALNFRWSATAGDFRVSSGMVDNPFQNFYFPEITARGLKVEVDQPGWRYTLFTGGETLPEGPRVPFRRIVPQAVLGASLQRNAGGRWQLGVRTLSLSSSPRQIERHPDFFPLNRQFSWSTSITAQSVYSVTSGLKLYAEGAIAATRRVTLGPEDGKMSGLAGLAFDNSMWAVKLNYTYQTTSYLPLLGYFAGDRRGTFSEIRFRPWRWLDVFGSSSAYENNLQRDPRVPVFRSRAISSGGALQLPWKLSLTAQLGDIRFSSSESPASEPALSTSRQMSISLARPLKHQTLRVGYRDLRLGSSLPSIRQRSAEVEDTIQSKHVALGGSVRVQEASGVRRTTTVYVRGSLQANFGRFTGFAQVENGNDLLNRTLFATSNFRTLVAGATARLWRGWDLRAEVFRNSLTTELNPENAFFQLAQGVPAQLAFSGFNQRSVYFYLSKHLAWGEPTHREGSALMPTRRHPCVGEWKE